MLKQSQSLKLSTKLSPQHILVIKMLELPTLELEEKIEKELEENPALEKATENSDNFTNDNNEELSVEEKQKKDNEFSLEDYVGDDDIPSYRLNANNYSKDDKPKDIPYSGEQSFYDYLLSQLHLLSLDEKQNEIAKFLIGTIDDDGYIRMETEKLVDQVEFKLAIKTTENEIEKIINKLQELDPAGIFARDLRECLLIQLNRKENKTLAHINAIEILKNYYNEFTKKHYDKIIKNLDYITKDDFKEAIDIIRKLNPKPGNSTGSSANKVNQSVIPDFILENNYGELKVSLNSRNTPELRINNEYKQMYHSYINKKTKNKEDKSAESFIKKKLDSASFFIDAIKQRENTLMQTIEAIIKYQYDFFISGDETQLKPMRLKDIAEITGLDISTISRVSNSKYIQTEFGTYKLKFFFSEGIVNDSGEEISTKEIKKILTEVIKNEDKSKPYTDEKLSQILKEKGYKVARRTVAKYREQLKIPVGRLRKQL